MSLKRWGTTEQGIQNNPTGPQVTFLVVLKLEDLRSNVVGTTDFLHKKFSRFKFHSRTKVYYLDRRDIAFAA